MGLFLLSLFKGNAYNPIHAVRHINSYNIVETNYKPGDYTKRRGYGKTSVGLGNYNSALTICF